MTAHDRYTSLTIEGAQLLAYQNVKNHHIAGQYHRHCNHPCNMLRLLQICQLVFYLWIAFAARPELLPPCWRSCCWNLWSTWRSLDSCARAPPAWSQMTDSIPWWPPRLDPVAPTRFSSRFAARCAELRRRWDPRCRSARTTLDGTRD